MWLSDEPYHGRTSQIELNARAQLAEAEAEIEEKAEEGCLRDESFCIQLHELCDRLRDDKQRGARAVSVDSATCAMRRAESAPQPRRTIIGGAVSAGGASGVDQAAAAQLLLRPHQVGSRARLGEEFCIRHFAADVVYS